MKTKILNIRYIIKERKVSCIINYINPINKCEERVRRSAVCNPEDDFDVTFGKHLSESRAKEAMYHRVHLYIKKFYTAATDKYTNYRIKEGNHIDDLIYGNK